jgi:alkanesulfonate monooxygenase SsuD/methylene tetrahydromethanopterin reductase-like flavin-dependent oxidoreductase (luciferase family)
VLREHCAAAGRDPAAITRSVGCKITIRSTEREAHAALRGVLARNGLTEADNADDATFWTGTPVQIAERMVAYRRVGFHSFIVESPAPYDAETLDALQHEVKPMVLQEVGP